MLTVVWTAFAAAVMLGGFAVCVIVVASGVRLLENALARHRSETH